MSAQDQTLHNIKVTNGDQLEDEQWVIDTITNANAAPPSTARIPLVPKLVKEAHDYEKYYVPKVVSIGPHHYGNKNLESVEQLKPVFTMILLTNKETLRSLYKKLSDPEMVKQLRSFYDENSTTMLSNKEFTKMMLQDSCFIMYYIHFIFGEIPKDSRELNSHQIAVVRQDLFLLENQIPFKVVAEVNKLLETDCFDKIKLFVYNSVLAPWKLKRTWSIFRIQKVLFDFQEDWQEIELAGDKEPDHLLHLLHRTLTKQQDVPKNELQRYHTFTFRNVNELVDVGIHFKPSDTKSLAQVKFSKGNWCFTASVELPPITVDDSTKPMFLNLIAYERCSCNAYDAWVTSYICFLESLIDDPGDVEVLRKAGVLEDSFGRDQEVVKLFNEIAIGLIPDPSAYVEAKFKIQRHYEIWKYSLISQIKHLYLKNPALFFSSFGIPALFLSVVQTYFTIWSPKGTCDDLCMFLKKNHHL